MSFDGDASRLSARSRNTRSHSLKPQSQPIVLKQRSKRTMSLPSKPVLLPLINVQRCYDNWDEDSDNDEADRNEEEMGTLHCFFNILTVFFNFLNSVLQSCHVSFCAPLRFLLIICPNSSLSSDIQEKSQRITFLGYYNRQFFLLTRLTILINNRC